MPLPVVYDLVHLFDFGYSPEFETVILDTKDTVYIRSILFVFDEEILNPRFKFLDPRHGIHVVVIRDQRTLTIPT